MIQKYRWLIGALCLNAVLSRLWTCFQQTMNVAMIGCVLSDGLVSKLGG